MGQTDDLYGALHPLPTVYLLKKTNNEKCCSKSVELISRHRLLQLKAKNKIFGLTDATYIGLKKDLSELT